MAFIWLLKYLMWRVNRGITEKKNYEFIILWTSWNKTIFIFPMLSNINFMVDLSLCLSYSPPSPKYTAMHMWFIIIYAKRKNYDCEKHFGGMRSKGECTSFSLVHFARDSYSDMIIRIWLQGSSNYMENLEKIEHIRGGSILVFDTLPQVRVGQEKYILVCYLGLTCFSVISK